VFAAGTQTFLHGHGSRVRARFLTEKHPLKLIHPGIGEQQGWISLWNESRAGNRLMALLLEITDKRPP
jgi:hypothetical protein